MLRNFLFGEQGNSASEYALIVALICAGVVGPLLALNEATSGNYLEVAAAIERAVNPTPVGSHNSNLVGAAEDVLR